MFCVIISGTKVWIILTKFHFGIASFSSQDFSLQIHASNLIHAGEILFSLPKNSYKKGLL